MTFISSHNAHILNIPLNQKANDFGSLYVHVALGLRDVIRDVGHTKYIKIISLGQTLT